MGGEGCYSLNYKIYVQRQDMGMGWEERRVGSRVEGGGWLDTQSPQFVPLTERRPLPACSTRLAVINDVRALAKL